MPADGPALVDVTARAVELARRAGAEQCDAFAQAYDESNVTVRRGDVEKLIEAGGHSLGLRVISGGRTAVCSTSDFSAEALEALAKDTVELAKISAPDEFAGLPAPSELARTTAGDGLQLYDESLRSLPVETRIAMARTCEAAALSEDRRITNTDGASLSARVGEVALANSLGFASSYPATSLSLVVEVMADDDDGKKRNAYWYSSERFLHRLASPEEVGRTAARRAVAQIGARKVPTRSVPVVFEPVMSVDLARLLVGCATGGVLYRGATFLANSANQRVGSSLVNIVDDPRLPGRGGSRPFDGEGVATGRCPLFEEGVFRGFLFDVYTARRAAAATTGSAHRGPQSLPAPGASNTVWAAGTMPATEIVAGVRDGLYVTTLMGFGFNAVTGDFSRGAAGFWIRDGELAYPVTEVNVSGRMGDMLMAIDAVGDDLTWFGASAAPTVRISEMMVSGT